jgi:hypothetical protein
LSSNLVTFTRQTYDPWYQATKNTEIRKESQSNGNFTLEDRGHVWIQDEPASPLACKTQEQICNPNQPEGLRCIPLASNADFLFSAWVAGHVFLNQTEWWNRLQWAGGASLFNLGSDYTRILAQLGAHALLSRVTLSMQGLQGPLPEDQWMSDAEHWFRIAMTSLQGSYLVSAVGPTDPDVALFYNYQPKTPEQQWMCNNQVRTSNRRDSHPSMS